MFTGLVEGTGKVKNLRRFGADLRLSVAPGFTMDGLQIGESVAVDGVCLTVTAIGRADFSADVSAESLDCTTLGRLNPGDRVNLERALRFSDRLGGHLVSGHVDGIGKLARMDARDRSWLVRVEVDPGLARHVIEKGSIAVDGISLTVNRCGDTYVEMNIIPQTGRETTLLQRKVGDPVNIETDMIGKYVEKFFQRTEKGKGRSASGGIAPEMLRALGYGQ